jgi:hypothetical protein
MLSMTNNEYLMNMRTLYNDNLRALKDAKDEFQMKLGKMQKAHQAQL